jgi:hypothetical protein
MSAFPICYPLIQDRGSESNDEYFPSSYGFEIAWLWKRGREVLIRLGMERHSGNVYKDY